MDSITCQVEGDEVVLRIPRGAPRVLIAIEGILDVWPAGWIVEQGATREIPSVLLYRPSTEPGTFVRQFADRHQSQGSAPAPETATPCCRCEGSPCPLSPESAHRAK